MTGFIAAGVTARYKALVHIVGEPMRALRLTFSAMMITTRHNGRGRSRAA